VKRFRASDAEALEAARAAAPFASLTDFHARVGLDAGALSALSEAGAFDTLQVNASPAASSHGRGGRRAALWSTRGLALGELDGLFGGADEPAPEFARLTAAEEIGWDHATSHHSVRGHPLAPLRAELRAEGLPDARGVAALADGARVRYAGLVICRQRPGTAAGITFMTLEDETGFVNLVVFTQVFERYALLAKTRSFLGVSGRVQRQGEVVHVLAAELWVPEVKRRPIEVESRDFH
jgi:error-prone DNA polymerase